MEKNQLILSVKDLNIQFNLRGKVLHAIRGIDLDIYHGEVLAIVGESGSGKSVFTKSFMGLLDANGSISSGTIDYFGADDGKPIRLSDLKKEKDWLRVRGHEIAMIMQDPMTSLNPLKTIGDQIMEAVELHQGLRGKAAREKTLEYLRDVGIADPEVRFSQYPHEFSGGMRQRVVIAIAVACNPQILHQLKDLCLNGHVQCGGGLVADQNFGAAGHRNGNDHALAHTAGELVRVLLEPLFRVRDAHIPQVFQRFFLGGSTLQALMQGHGFHDLVADGFERVQAGHGVLHDHGDLAAPHPQPVLLGLQVRKAQRFAVRHAVVINGAAGDGTVGIQQAHEAFGKNALTRAALAHDGQHFALVQIKVDAPDGVQHFSTQIESDADIFCGENELVVFHDIPSLLQMVLRVGSIREGVADQIERDGDKA